MNHCLPPPLGGSGSARLAMPRNAALALVCALVLALSVVPTSAYQFEIAKEFGAAPSSLFFLGPLDPVESFLLDPFVADEHS